MGFSAGLIWPEAIEDLEERERHGAPPELLERYLWPDWRMQFEEPHEAALEQAECGALLAIYMGDFSEDENTWTTPAELSAAAQRLKTLVHSSDPSIASVVELYEVAAEDGRLLEEETPARDMFLKELDVLVQMAEWAQKAGIARVAIEIG